MFVSRSGTRHTSWENFHEVKWFDWPACRTTFMPLFPTSVMWGWNRLLPVFSPVPKNEPKRTFVALGSHEFCFMCCLSYCCTVLLTTLIVKCVNQPPASRVDHGWRLEVFSDSRWKSAGLHSRVKSRHRREVQTRRACGNALSMLLYEPAVSGYLPAVLWVNSCSASSSNCEV